MNARYLLSMVLDGERRGRLASHGLSANLMIARQENARQGSRSHFPILVKLFALWWQMLVQTSDITVRSQIAKACATSGLRLYMFVSQLRCRYLRYSKLFLPLCSLADTDMAPFNFSRYSFRSRAHAADALASFVVKQTFTVSLAKTNVCDRFKRAFPECSARFVSACYLIRQPLLLTC